MNVIRMDKIRNIHSYLIHVLCFSHVNVIRMARLSSAEPSDSPNARAYEP